MTTGCSGTALARKLMRSGLKLVVRKELRPRPVARLCLRSSMGISR
jgi:hypothetical protein